jgi:hypothetical protein
MLPFQYIYIYTYTENGNFVYLMQRENGNSKLPFVTLGRQTVNSNRLFLCISKRVHLCYYYFIFYKCIYMYMCVLLYNCVSWYNSKENTEVIYILLCLGFMYLTERRNYTKRRRILSVLVHIIGTVSQSFSFYFLFWKSSKYSLFGRRQFNIF